MGLQSGNTVKPKSTRPVSETRKIRKPLMERKRRERINTSLNDLAALLTEANLVKGETGKPSKLEKADILELTVKHLKELKDKGGTCHASTSSGARKTGTETATVPEKACDSGEDTSSDNASNQHNELCEDKQKVENRANEAISDEERDEFARATCSLPCAGSVKSSSNVSENISSQDETLASLLEERNNRNSSSSAPSSSKGSVNNENYVLGFKKCMSAIEKIMTAKQDHENCHQETIRPKLLNHLKNFLKSIDIDLKTSVTSSKTSLDKLSVNGTEPSSKVADVSSTTSEGDQSSNVPMSNLTLVPTRLPGGNLAFVVQGGPDATVLIQSAEMMLQNPETKEEKFAQKRPTEGKGKIKSEDALLSDDVIKTRKKEEIRSIKVESGNYNSQIQNKETPPKQFPSQLPNTSQVFQQNTVTKANFTAQSAPTSLRPMTPAKPPPKVSQTPSESSLESKSHDQFNVQFTSLTPTVRPNTRKSLSSPPPSTSREYFMNKRAFHVSCATTTVHPSQPVDLDRSSGQLASTSYPQHNETATIPATSSTFAINITHNQSGTAFTPVKESTSFHFHLPVTPQTPNSENCNQQMQPSSLTSPLSRLCPNSLVLSTPTASTSSHPLYTDQLQFLTPPPTPIEHASLRKASMSMYQEESESLIVCHPPIPQHLNASTSSQAILQPPKSSVSNSYKGRAKTMEEKNAQERPNDRRDNDENPFMVEERRNHQDNELPFDLSLRRMWRPW
ncbi:mucin-3A-like [Macrobrachium nipponense]|uniref:mucin-3A-like n=1 Tax=Macrobrachium nipponense TaxID=159736 RepID=UPI0030C80784